VAISVAAFAIATGTIAWIVRRLTNCAPAALVASAAFALNPNVLYLQSTPMTEPLLLATILVAVALLIAWCRPGPAPAALARATALSQERRGWGPGAVDDVGPRER
jgi:4-amino-4-deoxy-L-arabinose transferase-like glycosyltransferase